MARLYGNENLSLRIVEALRRLGHDVLTSQEADNANRGIPDEEVLAYALADRRIVLTNNRKDFIRLHRSAPPHFGIVVYTVPRFGMKERKTDFSPGLTGSRTTSIPSLPRG